jgi:hypothetical protein
MPVSAGVDERVYAEAVSRGVQLTGDERERFLRPIELLAAATELTPALAVACSAVGDESAGEAERSEAASLLLLVSGALIRLGHRAREAHARDVGYDTETWLRDGLAAATHVALDLRGATAVLDAEADEAAAQLARAIVAVSMDRMAVPDAITQAQGRWLGMYAVARSMTRR